MTHDNFKSRLIGGLPAVPPELDLRLDEFVRFEANNLHLLAQEDTEFLITQGLPRQASPFLSFSAFSETEIQELIEMSALQSHYFPIGQNGSGDLVAIDLDSREVVYFNHDSNNCRIFINSTVSQFAECLCIYQEHLIANKMVNCLAVIGKIDGKSVVEGNMWNSEIMTEIAKLTN